LARQENQPLLIQIPNPFDGGESSVQIYVRQHSEESETRKGKKKQGFNLVFILNMSALGAVRVDTHVVDDRLSITMIVNSASVAEFIETSDIFSRMEEIGYRVTLKCCVQENVPVELEDPVGRLMVNKTLRLVDVNS
jgi:hypothetical protein